MCSSRIAFLAVALASCSPGPPGTGATEESATEESTTGQPELAPLCDGRQEIVAVIRSDTQPWATPILSEAGRDYFYLDGDCNYWAHGVVDESPLVPPRQGHLTPEAARELLEARGFSRWAEYAGSYWPPDFPGGTPGWITASGNGDTIFCGFSCTDFEGADEELSSFLFSPNLRKFWDEVRAQGEPLESPALVVQYASTRSVGTAATYDLEAGGLELWPFSTPPGEAPFHEQTEPSIFIEEQPGVVEELRAARDRYLSGELEPWVDNDIVDQDAEVLLFVSFDGEDAVFHNLSFRELLPFEATNGSKRGFDVPLPPP